MIYKTRSFTNQSEERFLLSVYQSFGKLIIEKNCAYLVKCYWYETKRE